MTPELAATLETLLTWVLPPLVVVILVKIAEVAVSAWQSAQVNRPELAAVLTEAARLAVLAAEQNGLTAKLKDQLYDKKTEAIRYVESYLAAQGIKLNLAVFDAAIDAAVFQEFNRAK